MDPEVLFLQIVDAIVALLNTDRPADVPVVTKRRSIPDGEEAFDQDMVGVFLGDENVDPPAAAARVDPRARRRMQVAVQCIGVTDDVEELDGVCGPMLAWAVAKLGKTNLGGLVHYVQETNTIRRPVYSDRYVMVATQLWNVSYTTRRDNLTVR